MGAEQSLCDIKVALACCSGVCLVPILRGQVCLFFSAFSLILGLLFGAAFGPQSWASNSACNKNLNVRVKLVPKTGFKNGPVLGTWKSLFFVSFWRPFDNLSSAGNGFQSRLQFPEAARCAGEARPLAVSLGETMVLLNYASSKQVYVGFVVAGVLVIVKDMTSVGCFRLWRRPSKPTCY